MIYAPYMFLLNVIIYKYVSRFHRKRKILLVSIKRDLLTSHQKEKMSEESLAVTRIKPD